MSPAIGIGGGMSSQGLPTVLNAVDVGVKYCAIAEFKDGLLAWAALLRQVQPLPYRGTSWRLVIERATVRQRDGHTKKREVEKLLLAAGRLGANHPSPEFWLPEEWKGQLKKHLDHKRSRERLSPEELARLPESTAELLHVMDAVGIGLRALGRR